MGLCRWREGSRAGLSVHTCAGHVAAEPATMGRPATPPHALRTGQAASPHTPCAHPLPHPCAGGEPRGDSQLPCKAPRCSSKERGSWVHGRGTAPGGDGQQRGEAHGRGGAAGWASWRQPAGGGTAEPGREPAGCVAASHFRGRCQSAQRLLGHQRLPSPPGAPASHPSRPPPIPACRSRTCARATLQPGWASPRWTRCGEGRAAWGSP